MSLVTVESARRPGNAQTSPAVVNTWIGGADMAQRTCSFEGCDKPSHGHGLCVGHNYQLRHGHDLAPLRVRPSGSPTERFWAYVDKASTVPCWLWTGEVSWNGYGRFKVGGSRFLAHRYGYTITKGVIPVGLQLDHLCRVTRCVNPDHLEPVTASENQLRAAPPTCPQGHPVERTSSHNRCRLCHQEEQRRYLARVARG